MTNSKHSKVRALVIGLLLAVAVGAPVASVVGNAPRRTAALAPSEASAPAEYEMPGMTVTPSAVTVPAVEVVGRVPARAGRAKKDAGEQTVISCRRVALEQQGIGYASSVKMCEG